MQEDHNIGYRRMLLFFLYQQVKGGGLMINILLLWCRIPNLWST